MNPPGSGVDLRDEQLTILERNRARTILKARRAFLTQLLQSADGTATVESVRSLVDLPATVKPQLLGAVPLGLKGPAGIIEFARYELAERPEAHARPLVRWRLVNRSKALAWLHDHPDPDATTMEESGQRLLFGREV